MQLLVKSDHILSCKFRFVHIHFFNSSINRTVVKLLDPLSLCQDRPSCVRGNKPGIAGNP
jgi:hypothetical protein